MRSRASFTIGWTDLDGSLRTGESTLLNKDGSAYLCLLNNEIGGGPGLSLPPVIMPDWAFVESWISATHRGKQTKFCGDQGADDCLERPLLKFL
jgi:hypothetical protein